MIKYPSNTDTFAQRCPVFLLSLAKVISILCWFIVGTTFSWANSDIAISPESTSSPYISMLEGKSFAGELGPLGKTAISTDLLEFRDGKFISQECERKCGYTDGIYWVRSDPDSDGIQVMSETPCLKSDATIVWRGTVKGDEIEGVFTWTSRRWYWTIEKEFWFNGKLVQSDAASLELK
jgi:hypothetical protein